MQVLKTINKLVPAYEYHFGQLEALNEMRIIYMFKSIELGLKSLIRVSYAETKVKRMYQWDLMIGFFQEKGIYFDKLEGYKEVLQLRILNNNFKHSNDLDKEAKKIPEFSADQMDLDSFDTFIKRIEPRIQKFYSEVTEQVIRERYDFGDTKLDELTLDLFQRMSRKEMIQFIKKLKNKYEIKPHQA